MRVFDYKKDYSLISTTIKGYIKTLKKELTLLIEYEKDKEYMEALDIVLSFQKKYSDLSSIQNKILDDLCRPYCIDYCFLHGNYPVDASIIGDNFEKDLKDIIVLEENLKKISIEKYKRDLTPYSEIVNGEDFMTIGHASFLKPGLQKDNNVNRVQYLSCSLFSNNELNTFQNDKIVYLVNVDENNFISASYVDSVTMETSSPSFLTLMSVNKGDNIRYINAGYQYDLNESVTSILTPKLVEMLSIKREVEENGEMYKYIKSQTNEIALLRTNTHLEGVLLIGNGCDLLFGEYITLKNNNQEFKCINKGLYRLKNNQSEYTEEEYQEFIKKLDGLELLLVKGKVRKEDIENYYKDVVVNMNYSENVLNIINERLSKYMEIDNSLKK